MLNYQIGKHIPKTCRFFHVELLNRYLMFDNFPLHRAQHPHVAVPKCFDGDEDRGRVEASRLTWRPLKWRSNSWARSPYDPNLSSILSFILSTLWSKTIHFIIHFIQLMIHIYIYIYNHYIYISILWYIQVYVSKKENDPFYDPWLMTHITFHLAIWRCPFCYEGTPSYHHHLVGGLNPSEKY